MRNAVFALTLSAAVAAHANEIDTRAERLAQELRCVTCQNQSLAESSTPLSLDLKRHLREGLAAGRSEEELRAEMVARYGEEVLYRPALHGGTVALWFGPLALLAVGGLVYWRQGLPSSNPSPQPSPARGEGANPPT